MKYLKLFEAFKNRVLKDHLRECGYERNVRMLNCSGEELTSLDGVEVLTELEHLNCSENKLKSLRGIEKCTKIDDLVCSGNRLSNLKGIENLDLYNLDCSYNLLENLDEVENLNNLEYLTAHQNPIQYPNVLPKSLAEGSYPIQIYRNKIDEFKTYEFQKNFLKKFPQKISALEPFGYAEGIKKEFAALFAGKEWGFFDLERSER